jgi:hypothetical protein
MGLASFHDRYAFGFFRVGDVRFPRLLLGTSPFVGASQFGERSMEYYLRFYLNPGNITRLYLESISRGLNAIHVLGDPVIAKAVVNAVESSGVRSFILATINARNLEEELSLCEAMRADSIIVHGSYTDFMKEGLSSVLKKIKDRFGDIPAGIATHLPGKIIPEILDISEVKVIMAPINLKGEFMEPNVDSTLRAISESRRKGVKVIAMKSLAAGKLKPREALRFISDKVDGVAVGVTSTRELDELIEEAKKSLGPSSAEEADRRTPL